MKKISKNNSGQALISLMFFVIIAMFLISAAIVIMIVSSESTGQLEGKETVIRVAEAAGESALIKYLRDPSFAGETLNLPDGDATSSISGGVITVTATSNGFNEKIEITTNFAGNIMSVVSWKEVY
jgi:hypothetical protein